MITSNTSYSVCLAQELEPPLISMCTCRSRVNPSLSPPALTDFVPPVACRVSIPANFKKITLNVSDSVHFLNLYCAVSTKLFKN